MDVYIGYLRKKVERPGRPRLIHTRRGQGYMLGPGVGALLARMVADTLTPEDEEVLEDLSLYREFGAGERLE